MTPRATLALCALACAPRSYAGPPPMVSQLVAGLQLDAALGEVLGGEVEVNTSTIGIGIGAGLVVETDAATTAGLRVLFQVRPMGMFVGEDFHHPTAMRWFDPFVQFSATAGAGDALRAFLAADYGIDVGLWPSRWHPVAGVRARSFLGQTPSARSPIVLFTLGVREFDEG